MADTPSHFFIFVLSSTIKDQKLMIPESFARRYGGELSGVATLRVPNGRVWHVGLRKCGKKKRKMWLEDGWSEFIEYHSISAGYFLFFRYEKSSSFYVLIFDVAASEIVYPQYYGLENEEGNLLTECEVRIDDCVEIKGPETPVKREVFDEWPSDGSCNKVCSSTTLELIGKKRSSSSVLLSNRRGESPSETQRKRCKVEEESLDNENSGQKANMKNMIDEELLSLLVNKRICVSQRFGIITSKESARAFNVVKTINPKTPSFLIFLRARNISKSFLYMPVEFANRYLTKDMKFINLQVSEGRQWPVQLVWRHWGGPDLTRGWAKFLRDNKLKKEDILVFELMRKKDTFLKVSVFPYPDN